MRKYLQYTIFAVLASTSFTACTKDTVAAEIKLSNQMISDKTWYLDYSVTGAKTKTYIGQSTYFINFLKNLTTQDSDGLTGTYSVEKIGGQLQIHVQANTGSGNKVEYIYNVESVGSKNLILSYTISAVQTRLYYSSK